MIIYVIITYDVNEKRVGKTCKKLKEYLIWTQNSVFEGEITKGTLDKCLSQLNDFLNLKEDSVNIYIIKNPKHLKKEIFGKDKSEDDLFL